MSVIYKGYEIRQAESTCYEVRNSSAEFKARFESFSDAKAYIDVLTYVPV